MNKPPIVVFVGDTHVGSDTGLAMPNWEIKSKEGRIYPMSPMQDWLFKCWQDTEAYIEALSRFRDVTLCLGGDSVDGVNHHNSTQTFGNRYEQRRMAVALYQMLTRHANEVFMTTGTNAHGGEEGDEDRSVADWLKAEASEYFLLDILPEIFVDWAHHGIANIPRNALNQDSPLNNEAKNQQGEAWQRNTTKPSIVVRHHIHQAPEPIMNAGMWVAVVPAFQLPSNFVKNFQPTGLSSIGHLTFDPYQPKTQPNLFKFPYAHKRTRSKSYEFTGNPGITVPTVLGHEPDSAPDGGDEGVTTTWGQ